MHSVGDITDTTASDKVYNLDERALTLTYGPTVHSSLVFSSLYYRYGRAAFTREHSYACKLITFDPDTFFLKKASASLGRSEINL